MWKIEVIYLRTHDMLMDMGPTTHDRVSQRCPCGAHYLQIMQNIRKVIIVCTYE
jgi:hypothetical protein